MDYIQDQVTTLHDLADATPDAPVSESAVVVPIAGDRIESVTPEHVFTALSAVDPVEVVVPLRAPGDVAERFRKWVRSFDLSATVLWCDADALEATLVEHGIDGDHGKGRDVWLGLGVAASRAEYVAVHDADATTYSRNHVPRLLAPLGMGYSFAKGYYARVEDGRLYGRLTRLFVAPLIRALETRHHHPFVRYLAAFRYPLAGEFALTADLARRVRLQRRWGLEIGLLGEAFGAAGSRHSAQVDLGFHRHDHHPVTGDRGLSTMALEVGTALFRAVDDHGVDVDYAALSTAYREAADRLVEQYAADAAFNGLAYDPDAEREQSRTYADGIRPPGPDARLPTWADTTLSPSAVVDAAAGAIRTDPEPETD
ncbi:glucosyl-3-phosphoglycerate synthase [Halalkaliarchaeum desulfuricum]|uniref:Glucosyl-3-phosphoglycerate synthase n=1 Tax=Halalkaliarchaeum desulfuricum TaxID=2055893 RepID=A0A343TJ81_9EURY|nr:glycosyl transferase family 2 [Halalkaliarchaeum desulfuricum]AUX09153.1 glucosyl-3-phosphoglycerate synthase [Halalkaliarchaeum desulfuricum]